MGTALVFRIAGGRLIHYDVIADPHRLACCASRTDLPTAAKGEIRVAAAGSDLHPSGEVAAQSAVRGGDAPS